MPTTLSAARLSEGAQVLEFSELKTWYEEGRFTPYFETQPEALLDVIQYFMESVRAFLDPTSCLGSTVDIFFYRYPVHNMLSSPDPGWVVGEALPTRRAHHP